MRPYEVIRAKRDGEALSPRDIRALIEGYTAGQIPDYQMAAFCMAVFYRGMDEAEMAALTDAMLHSGTVLDLSAIPGVKVDKHSTGGVGDKVSLALAPLVAAAGVPVPMISGRGLGHTGGTLDKLEAIPGFRVDLSIERFVEIVGRLGVCLIGQTREIAPADRKLYALRDVTATVESVPLIAASIMSKKLAEGIDALVLDVKVGRGAFMKSRKDARTLAGALAAVGKRAKKKVVAVLTAMDEPLGLAVGNALETAEAFDVLRGGGPRDLVEVTRELGAHMLVLGKKARGLEAARARLDALIRSGEALDRMRRLVEAQGGDPRAVDDPARLPRAPAMLPVRADRTGFVTGIDAEEIGLAAMSLGAGRDRADATIDPSVGIVLERKTGDAVAKGELLAVVHHAGTDAARAGAAASRVRRAYVVGARKPRMRSKILEVAS
ncbi:MAG: thymidine phosphorylase [Deltaproteobacteria bacterium]|nr:thymidine phosphorylase [Deltaproteobacteria bacterium]